jgi:uncharacterized OB-fold protein
MEVARHWRLSNQRYKLQGSVCNCCGKAFFAPRPICDACSQHEAPAYSIDESALRRQTVESAYAVGK